MRNYLKRIREGLGLTQQKVAEKLDISLSYYNLIENGDRQKNMDLLMANKISQALNVTVEFIISEESKLLTESA
jgi:XRE family transcriptional regulator, fatty acid utilization regulator